MAVELESPIDAPLRDEWLARTAINGGDIADVVEPAQQLYARQGGSTHHVVGPFETTSTSLTVTNDLDNGDLDEFEAVLLPRRPTGSSAYEVAAVAWGYDVEMELELTRVNADGSTDVVGTATVSEGGSSASFVGVTIALSESDIYDNGSTSNDQVPIIASIRFRHINEATTEAHLSDIVVFEDRLGASDL